MLIKVPETCIVARGECTPGTLAPDVIQVKCGNRNALVPVWLGINQVPLCLLANLRIKTI